MRLTNAKRICPKRDIICYKVVERNGDGYITPYQKMAILPFETTLFAEGALDYEYASRTLRGGVFHCFKYKKDAIYHAMAANVLHDPEDFVILKCRIPANATVFSGDYEAFLGKIVKCVASPRLEIFGEI